ncbi:MAG: hypothetical protein A3E80_05965, partial [Chlamydiae bacterium RIFCSPHIGHO2_12_FULL_49_9]
MMKTDTHWKKVGLRHHHGICIPLFSLHTEKSCGIGEFFDLIPMIDWCECLGLDCIQLLPLNESSDGSPYNPLSSCALDPIYLSLASLPNPEPLDHFLPLKSLTRIAKAEVKHLKLKWLYTYFEKNFPADSKTPAYKAFLEKHSWLNTYALFKSLKDEYGGKNWKDWPQELQTPPPFKPTLQTDFHIYLQYLCFSQLEEVCKYATSHNIFLKGDVPILLSADSADVWAESSLFDLSLSAGAPPDLYNPLGQGWGFPLFNWDNARKTNFSWWKRRLATLQSLYHIYRIDHVVGFFRIWAIEEGKLPSDGRFVPLDPALWLNQGCEILNMMIVASPLLPIAEDLGVIPDEVYATLKHLGIPGTKVLIWQRHWDTDKSFIPYSDYEPLSLTTVSTADMEPLSLWWKNHPEDASALARFKHWRYNPILTPDEHAALLHDSHHTASLFHINPLQEYLALFPNLTSPNLEDERINIPGT